MGKIIKKGVKGAATNYITRKAALKKLQLSLNDFSRLCILKGVYPHEPKHRKKVGGGSTKIKTLYYAKDILFLQHEPIINKFREYKIFLRKQKRYWNKKDTDRVERLQRNRPQYKLDHVVKERYPSFIDAIRDLDDGLCLCFLFSRLPRSTKVPTDTVTTCRRLTVEFMHYIIASKSLRKVFVSIKGIYYQADVQGQTVTWIVPHERGFPQVTQVDFRVMSTFVEFYTTALGFVNYRLFQQLGLQYPPQGVHSTADDDELYSGDSEAPMERLFALGESLKKLSGIQTTSEDAQIDEFPPTESDADGFEHARKEYQKIKNLQKLFAKCKFFLSRETPRESLAFVIRCCGGEVSWDPTVAYGSTYGESDETITHQIMDRDAVEKQHLSRRYVQPQWVYDSINARILLPAEDYYVGCILPAHLSPFVDENPADYVPPEKVRLLQMQGEDVSKLFTADPIDDDGDDDDALAKSTEKNKTKQKIEPTPVQVEMKVEKGKLERIHKQKLLNDAGENKKLQEMMIPKKHRRVYQKILKKQKHVTNEAKNLKEKRQNVERNKKKMAKID